MTGTSRAAVLKRAESAMREERWLDAIKVLSENHAEGDWKISWNLGWCYFKLHRFGEAGRCFSEADGLAPKSAICKWALGQVYIKKRQYRKAESVLSESLQIKESYLTRVSLALAYLAQGKIVQAEATHLDGIRIKTRLSERYESYAAFLSDVGREAESEKIMRKVRTLRSVN